MFPNLTSAKDTGTLPAKSTSGISGRVSIPLDECRQFRYFLIALVLLSAVAASIEGGIHPALLVPAIPLVVAALLRKDYSKAFAFSETVVSGLLLLYAVVAFVGLRSIQGGTSWPIFLVYLTFGTVLARVVSPLTDRNVAQLIFLTLGLILINCILTNHLLFGVLLPAYLFALMSTLLLFQLARHSGSPKLLSADKAKEGLPERWYAGVGKYALLIVALTIFAFALLPRPFFVIPGFRTAMAGGGGYSDLQKRISYRDMASMGGRERIAFAVKLKQGTLPETPYWRGRVLDRNDSGGWVPSSEQRRVRHFGLPDSAANAVYDILPYRLQSNVVYVSGLPLAVWGRSNRVLEINSEGEVSINSPFLYADSYRVRAVTRPIPAGPGPNAEYLDRGGITPAIEQLALQWTSGSTRPRDKAAALMAKLRSQFSYKLVTPAAPEDVNPVEHFLFKTRTGNCEYFAGALCLLLRSVGVPARVVEGFAGGEKTAEPSEILVRFSMAHAWVEALLDGSPWTVLDPTPEMRGESLEDILWRLIADAYYQAEYQWIRQVVHFDRSDQTAMLQRIRGMLAGDISPGWLLSPQARAVVPAILIAGLCAGIVMVYLQMRRKWLDPSAIYLDTMRQLVRAGVLEKMEPWYERNTASILARVPEARESYLAFMDIYLRARFDPAETVAPERLRAARNVLLAKVKMALSSI